MRAETVELAGATAKFDLTLALTECDLGLRGVFEYSTDLFERATIERMARHFIALLRGIAAHPERSIEELPLLSKDERARILVQWNRTAAGYAEDRCMHELFELQTKRAPGACAVECAGASITYDELNRRANQLARYLRKLGIGPDKPVGICLERLRRYGDRTFGDSQSGRRLFAAGPGVSARADALHVSRTRGFRC